MTLILTDFPNLELLRARQRSVLYLDQEALFLKNPCSKGARTKLYKIYKYLLRLSQENAAKKIREKYSEQDFIQLLEGAIWQAHDAGVLDRLEELMSSLKWNHQLDEVVTVTDLTSSKAMLPYADSFKQASSLYPEDFLRFEKDCLTQPIKDTFYTGIFPKAIHDKNGDIGLSAQERLALADLRFENTQRGFDAIKAEHERGKEGGNFQSYSRDGMRAVRKRSLELELISCFLVSLTNAAELQQQLESSLKARMMQEMLSLQSREYASTVRILYEMTSGELMEAPESFPSPLSTLWYLDYFLPVLQIFCDAYEM